MMVPQAVPTRSSLVYRKGAVLLAPRVLRGAFLIGGHAAPPISTMLTQRWMFCDFLHHCTTARLVDRRLARNALDRARTLTPQRRVHPSEGLQARGLGALLICRRDLGPIFANSGPPHRAAILRAGRPAAFKVAPEGSGYDRRRA